MTESMTVKLNPKQEPFCQLYATEREFFGNGTQSYIEAYDPEKVGNWYNTARSRASELLTSPNVLARINELLDITLNDQHVDKQLALVVTQNADFSSQMAAIREYNTLKQRITDKVEHSGLIATTPLTQDQIDAINRAKCIALSI